MKRIIILTGSELRHTFLRRCIARHPELEVLATYCEGAEKSLTRKFEDRSDDDLQKLHIMARDRSEADFFRNYAESVEDESRPVFIPKGDINSDAVTRAIIDAKPDLLAAYGCSIIREPLLSAFGGRFLNVHLGLSPYYRGSGTNYFPLVNDEPEFVGATFMYIDAGIDTGEIIHQLRAQIGFSDTPATIGNRLIADVAPVYAELMARFDELEKLPQLAEPDDVRICRQRDFTPESVEKLYANFKGGIVERYLEEREQRWAASPILVNPALADLSH